MWLFTKKGFYSVVAHNTQPNMMLVRGRVREDMQALVQAGTDLGLWEAGSQPVIHDNLGTDYAFRIFITRRQWLDLAWTLVSDIDYGNFKDAAHDRVPGRSTTYMRVWSAMKGLQDDLQQPTRAHWRPDDPVELKTDWQPDLLDFDWNGQDDLADEVNNVED